MRDKVFFDGKICRLSVAKISALSSAALYGRGIFTTVAVHDGKPFLWHLHENRLRDNAAKINLDLAQFSFENLFKSLIELLFINKQKNGRARITLFETGSSRLWQTGAEKRTQILITAAEKNQNQDENFHLTISPFRLNTASPLIGVKSCNYLEKLLALEAVRGQGFSEALSANERGEVASATMANVFWIKNKKIFTPALSTGALAGTTRQFVVELARRKGFTVAETIASIEELETAEEIFLTSAGLGICPVNRFNEKLLSRNVAAELRANFVKTCSEFQF